MADNWKAGQGQRIEKLYAWVGEEPDGSEGVLGWNFPDIGWMPLVGADKARVESYRQFAEISQGIFGRPVRLKMFAGGQVIDEIKP